MSDLFYTRTRQSPRRITYRDRAVKELGRRWRLAGVYGGRR